MTGIWGIVNVTPDSFSDGGRYFDPERAIAHGLSLCEDGATVLDVGGESTRPGSERVDPAVEEQRVVPVIQELAAQGIPVSVDTLNASTAVAAVRAGARIVNDVSGGLADPEMLSAVAESGADFAIGHWRGPSDDMYALAEYSRAAREVAGELRERIEKAAAAGIAPARLIVDPGIGFAKAGAQNWDVLRGLADITALGYRVLIGTSRKLFLADTLRQARGLGALEEIDEARRDLATAVTSALAVRHGVWAVRVHNVAATRDALAIAHAWEG
ncbi:dihydropteroate synthase [Microbacterium sp. CH12i]|uniref:dihydropteroate synthase n=1 Tax=Microbacterium sp. CH12i TaxID=1479651 RepID=UPI00046182B2|nr:dihydropteroate synthase [Microbacterium sp. CH12i]KDA05398.1 dihydropteroate synthase [Microbacterium sp. CH12i]